MMETQLELHLTDELLIAQQLMLVGFVQEVLQLLLILAQSALQDIIKMIL